MSEGGGRPASAGAQTEDDARALDLRRLAPALLVGAVTFVACFAFHEWLFDRMSGDADEQAYILQARMLQGGKLTLPASEWSEFFRPWLMAEHDGRLFGPYLPGWPAFLALADWSTGSFAAAPAAMAAAWVVATYLLALELLADRRTALVAAVLVALSPLVIAHGALFLAYGFGATALTFMAAALLRGDRLGSPWWLAAAGAAAGAGLLSRTFDALVLTVPVVAYVVALNRRQPRRIVRSLGLAVAGGAPFVAVLLLYDAALTGDPLLPPLAATDPANTIGFGPRRFLASEPYLDYGPREAWDALVTNLAALPSWLAGGAVLVGLALAGAAARGRRGERVLLVALALAPPAAHFFWWGTALSAPDAVNAIVGPHYYVGMVAPLAALAAAAVVAATRARPSATLAAVVVLGLLVLPSVGDKLDDQRTVNDGYDFLADAIPDDLPTPSVLMIREGPDNAYVGNQYQFLQNDPDLRQPTLYAAARGVIEHRLADAAPGRRLFRFDRREAQEGDEPIFPSGSLRELSTVKGDRIVVRMSITNTTGDPAVVAYAGNQRRVLDTVSREGDRYEVEWVLSPTDGAPGVVTVGHDQFVALGVALAESPSSPLAEQWEQRISAGLVDGRVQAQLPGYHWRRVVLDAGAVWANASVDAVLELTARVG